MFLLEFSFVSALSLSSFSPAAGWYSKWDLEASPIPFWMSDETWKSKLLSPVWLFATPRNLQSTESPGQTTGVGSRSLLQGIVPTQGLNPGLPHCRWILWQLSHQGSPRILEWVTYSFSSRSFQPRNQTGVSCIAGGFFTIWAIREALESSEEEGHIFHWEPAVPAVYLKARNVHILEGNVDSTEFS